MFCRTFQALPATLLALALSGCSTGDNTHRIWSQAGSAAPTLPPQPQQFPNLPQSDYMRGNKGSVCHAVPEYAFTEYLRDDHELVIGVKSRYTTVQHATYQAVLKHDRSSDHSYLYPSDLDLEHPRFEYSAYSCLELDQVRWAAAQVVQNLSEIYVHPPDFRTYQTDVVLPPEQSISQARALMRSYGIPDELVGFNRGAPLLPSYYHLRPLRTATGEIVVPRIVELGNSLPIRMHVRNNERSVIYRNFAWRIIRLDTEEIVRQVEESEIPYWGALMKAIEPGSYLFPAEGPAVWNLTDMDGQPVPPGKYVLQASAGAFMRPPDVMFEVVEEGGNTPLKRLQGLWYGWWY